MSSVKELDCTYIAHTYNRFPVEIVDGKGSIVTDETGKTYIDLSTGIAVNTFGHADEEWQKAVAAQMAKFQHVSNLFYSEPCAKLAQMLCTKTGMKKVFFSNSGAEANECAIKVARKYAAQHKGSDCYHIITLKNSFHGRTITTLAATGQNVFHQDFLPLTDGFLYADPADPDTLIKLTEEYPVAAIMFETVQGEGGVLPLTEQFVSTMVQLAKEKDILLICDEVQTGNGRTGKLYGYMHFDITPDIVSTAKGLGGGLPLGATMLGEKVKDILIPGSHGSTFGGNPVCCAGAISVFSRLTDELMSDVTEKSAYIFEALKDASGVKSVSGLGFMIGIETEKPAAEVVTKCRERGVLVITAKQKVRLLPALNIPMDELAKAINIIKEVCAI